jgi:hypothetical protein
VTREPQSGPGGNQQAPFYGKTMQQKN